MTSLDVGGWVAEFGPAFGACVGGVGLPSLLRVGRGFFSSIPYIFYAGGANPQKGPHILLRAFRLLREWGVDVGLVMTGTAGTWVEALARRYGVGQGGEVSREAA